MEACSPTKMTNSHGMWSFPQQSTRERCGRTDRSKRSRCQATHEGPSEAYSRYAATSAQGRQRRRWASFSGLSDDRVLDPIIEHPLCLALGARKRSVVYHLHVGRHDDFVLDRVGDLPLKLVTPRRLDA